MQYSNAGQDTVHPNAWLLLKPQKVNSNTIRKLTKKRNLRNLKTQT